MPSTLNLSLTTELRAFVDQNVGDDTMFATPSEFIRALLREKKEREEAAALREAVLEGYGDIEQGRTLAYQGDVRGMIRAARENGADV